MMNEVNSYTGPINITKIYHLAVIGMQCERSYLQCFDGLSPMYSFAWFLLVILSANYSCVHWLQDVLRDVVLLVFANKQDLPNAMNDAEITDKLGLHFIRQRHW
jgi:hypothetical protein